MKNQVVLSTYGLYKNIGNKQIISNMALEVYQGDVYGFLGPNGSGKTTTIRMLVGLIKPTMGNVKIFSHDIQTDFIHAMKNVGVIVEAPSMYSYLSGRKNLEIIAALYKDLPQNRIDEVLELVGLSKRKEDKVKTYSLGMKQRLGIAQALLSEPKIVILDEPTNGLDPSGMREIRELIMSLAKEKKITFFISSHLLSEIQLMCNRVCIINKGTVIKEGYVKELLNKDTEVYVLQLQQIKQAKDLLSKKDYIEEVTEQQDGLRIQLIKGYFNEMNAMLVHSGIDIFRLSFEGQSLEELYINSTEGGDQIA